MHWTSQNLVHLKALMLIPVPTDQRKLNELCGLTQPNQEELGKKTSVH